MELFRAFPRNLLITSPLRGRYVFSSSLGVPKIGQTKAFRTDRKDIAMDNRNSQGHAAARHTLPSDTLRTAGMS